MSRVSVNSFPAVLRKVVPDCGHAIANSSRRGPRSAAAGPLRSELKRLAMATACLVAPAGAAGAPCLYEQRPALVLLACANNLVALANHREKPSGGCVGGLIPA